MTGDGVGGAERARLAESLARSADWKSWGPYVSERAWGSVREDYSASGDAWTYFPHDQARSRAYRWNEDGLGGFCNRHQNLCLAVALWNGRDPILKERLFGLSGPEGNHGEDIKEYHFHLDGAPTHSYMKMLYKYPQAEFPYERLVRENARRGRGEGEFELIDALGDQWREGRYFDVFIEYAKADPNDLLCRITAVNRGPDEAELHILPHVWFRNRWSWGYPTRRPELRAVGDGLIRIRDDHLGERWWRADVRPHEPALLFTENATNSERLFGSPNAEPFVKDAFHETIVNGRSGRVNPDRVGTKAAAHYRSMVAPGESMVVRVRFAPEAMDDPFGDFDVIIARRIAETDEFYDELHAPHFSEDERRVQRQAFAGLLWNKQFYHYSVELWRRGDPAGPPPPADRAMGRNADWEHMYCLDVLSVPDNWEYPWFAAWDTAFHCIPLARLDPEWAKRQLVLPLREWYMHPNGQLPAYEWDFSDVNPPVHAHAARLIARIDRERTGRLDVDFLEEVFQKLLMNFTWWVNRKDVAGRNAFQGGFLGMDNIGVFDRSRPEGLPDGGMLEQADGTAWMGLYCLDMLAIALELAESRPVYESMATKFFEHFIAIAHSINGFSGRIGMWDEDDRFYYDVIRLADGRPQHLRLRSFVGLVPLFATLAIPAETWDRLTAFRRRVEWYLKHRPTLASNVCLLTQPGANGHRLMTIADRPKLETVLAQMLDPERFLSEYGLRSLSREHAAAPFSCEGRPFACGGRTVEYEPAESVSPIYGGNSNWRGPIWFPVNALMIASLREYHRYYGESLTVEHPVGSGRRLNLAEVADDLSRRLSRIFLREGDQGRRAVFGDQSIFQHDPHWRDCVPFHEYFHGENGAGLGASHQTGWTAMIAELMQRECERRG